MYKGMLTTTTTTAKPTTPTTSTVKPTTTTTVLTSSTTISTVKSVVYYKPSEAATSDAVHHVIIQGIETGLFFHTFCMFHPFISCSSCLCLEIYHSK